VTDRTGLAGSVEHAAALGNQSDEVGIGMRVEEDKVRGATAVMFFRRDDEAGEISQKSAEIRRLLKMPADTGKFSLTYSPVRGAENELAVNSRSMLQIMSAFSSYVEIPEIQPDR
jgi:hypothetical protein